MPFISLNATSILSPDDKLLPFTHKTVKINIDMALNVSKPTFKDVEYLLFTFIFSPFSFNSYFVAIFIGPCIEALTNCLA